MTEVVTYIRCQINGKWTYLGIIAEEDEIKEHFEFVEGLLKEKQRADSFEARMKYYRNQRLEDYKIVQECTTENAKLKKRADEFEKRWDLLKQHVTVRTDMCKEERMIREATALIDVMAVMHNLEEDGE